MRAGRPVRLTLVFAFLIAPVAGAQPGPARPAPVLAFAPAAYARGDVRTPELAQRMGWPELDRFRRTHQQGAAARPIRLLHGRLVYWEKAGAAAALGAAPRIEDVFARGEQIARLTRKREQERATAVHRATHAQFDAVWKQFDARGKSEGDGALADEVVLAVAPGSRDLLRRAWIRDEGVSAGTIDAWLARLPVDRWLARSDQPFVHAEGDRVFAFRPAASASAGVVDGAAWQDWTYTATLMSMPAPLYVEQTGWPTEEQLEAQEKRFDVVRAVIKKKPAGEALVAVRTMLDGPSWPNDHAWGMAADFAEKQGDIELALALRARYQPMGTCSMDSSPQFAAREYADLCHRAGRLGCFLNLQVQIMGDQFPRVASSSFGEEAHDTEAGRLRDIGIDVPRFLRGLLYQFDAGEAEPRALDPWRLARSIGEAGLGPAMIGVLQAEAQRPGLDPYNRLRAVQTLAYLRQQQVEIRNEALRDRADLAEARLAPIRADLSRLSLTPEAWAWVAAYGRD
jgi:hypothetical protein